MISTYFKSYRAKDWITLVVFVLVLAVCGVVGSSYSFGRGEPTYSLFQIVGYTLIFTVIFGIILVAFNLFLDLITKRLSLSEAPHPVTEISSRTEPLKESSTSNATDPLTTKTAKVTKALKKLTPRWNAKSVAIFALVMLLLWSPWIVAYFPAPLNVDTYHQIYQFFPDATNYLIPFGGKPHNVQVDAWLVDHHPVFTTIIYGSFGWLSEQLTGNWEAGVFLCSLMQAICFVIVYSASIAFLRREGCPIGLCFAIWVFFAIMPFIAVWSISLTKDAMFTLFFIPYLMMIFKSYKTNGQMFDRPRNVVFFILCSLALCLTKKTGVYLVIVVSLVLAWRFKRAAVRVENRYASGECARSTKESVSSGNVDVENADIANAGNENVGKKARKSEVFKHPSAVFLSSAAICALTMFVLLPCLIFPALNIHEGGKQEALGLPFQQTARYVVLYEDEITPQERESIDKVLAIDEIKDEYNPRIHDYAKFLFNQNASTQDLIDYFKTYFSMGMKHPEVYFDAFMGSANFYVSYTTPVYITLSSDINYRRNVAYKDDADVDMSEPFVIWEPQEVEEWKAGLTGAYYAICNIPGLGFILLLALYTLWIPASLLLFMLRHELRCKAILLPNLIVLLFCLISPMGATRYAVPMFCTIPLIVGMVVVLALWGRITPTPTEHPQRK